MKLRYKLNLFIIGLIVLSISIPFSIYYYFTREAIKDQVNNYLKLELTKNAYEIKGWLDTQSQAIVILSNLIQKNYEKEEITEELLKSYITSENVSDLYVGYEDGGFVSGIGWVPDAGYDPRVRPWYREMMESGKITVSNIYFDYTSDEYAVSIGTPLIDKNGKTIGVIAEDILLYTFYEKIKNIRLRDGGYAYLMDLNGNILVHRDKGLYGQNFQELTEGEVEIDLSKLDLSKKQEGHLTYTYKGEKKIVVYDVLPGTNWVLALVAVEKAAYQPLNNLLVIFLCIAVLNILLASILTGIFNRSIVHRLKLLSDASIALSEGEFDIVVEDRGKDEVGEVSTAFNRMKSEIREKIAELNLSRANYEELVENTADAIFSVNKKGYLITANSAFLQLFSCDRSVMEEVLFAEIVKGNMLGVILNSLVEEVFENKILIQRKIDDMEQRYYNIVISPINDNETGEIEGATTIIHDVSDLEMSRNHLEWITHHDGLTKLPNRLKFLEDLDMVILKAKSNKSRFLVLLIDLDNFRNINDTMGYVVGDAILIKIANLLKSSYKAYRTGADEFAIVLEDESMNLDLRAQVGEIAQMIHGNYQIELHTIYLTTTIGIVSYPDDFSDINEMMVRMDAALNYAKVNKRSEIQFYEHFISEELERRVVIENGLRHALENEEFVLFYQPIMCGSTKKIKGFEALIRWKKEDGTIVSPGVFMPIAEHMLLMHEVGLWIIHQALSDLKVMQEIYEEPLTMAINISANQIKRADFCEKVLAIMEELNTNPMMVEFEITETVLIESLEQLKTQFQPLINFGIRISLDDFGTGYSSLNYLQHFPFHILKIDKSFVDCIRKDMTSKNLINHIINIAHGMEMEIVAEGVENELQSEYLADKQCDYLQGYLYSRPIPIHEIFKFLRKVDR